MAIAFVEGFDAADITKISAKSLAEEQEGIGDVGEDGQEQFRLVSGYGALIDHLNASIKSQFSRIELRTRATSVHWSRGRVEIVARRGARQFKYTGQRAIITLPIGVLHSARLIEFDPELPRIRAAARQLGAGPVVKVILRFRDPFWENLKRGGKSLRTVSFLHNPGANIPTWWTTAPLRASMLTGWAGGSAAQRLSGKSHATIARTALDALAGMLNLKRSRLRALLLAAHVADWLSDPFARGAYSYVMVNGQQARRILATPVDDTLWFAGEAADTGDQASTVAGALASGERAARSILRA
jgi:monoamine oxidase